MQIKPYNAILNSMSVFDVRLRISDPPGFIAFVEVATTILLPSAPANQTAYKVTADGNYYATDEASPVTVPDDYDIQELLVSDARIEAWITEGGEDFATCQSIKNILPQLGKQMQIVRTTTGAETTEYQTLKDTYTYYKDLLALCTEEKKSNEGNNSGRMGGSKAPVIAGGDV